MKFWKNAVLWLLCLLFLTGCGGEKASEHPGKESVQPSVSADAAESIPGYGEEDGPLYTDGGSEDGTNAGESYLDEDGTYSSAEDVALYLHTYGELPDNFITKSEARDLGWSGGGLENYAPGKCIGGDSFGNREGLLPKGNYYECDINTLGAKSRGAERLVWDDKGNIYYTNDHYESFEQLYSAK